MHVSVSKTGRGLSLPIHAVAELFAYQVRAQQTKSLYSLQRTRITAVIFVRRFFLVFFFLSPDVPDNGAAVREGMRFSHVSLV